MEILLLIVVVWATKGAWDHAKGARTQSRDQRTKEVAKSYPKGALPKSRQKAAARQAAAGWWAREVRHGFPVHRTGWHAAWLAHQTVADHHKARREEARTTALETRASVLKGMPEHKQRQAEAQAELDEIEKELAAQQAKGSPATGRKAVESAADEVARRREQRVMVTDRCRNCGAPDGYDHLDGCDRSAPPLPADSVRPAGPVVTDTPVRVRNAEDSANLGPGDKRCEGCDGSGRNAASSDACPVCRGFGSGPPEPMSPLAAPDAVCTACGNTGKPGDPVVADPGGNIHLSHAQEQQEAYWDRLNRERARQRAEEAHGERLNRPGHPWPFDEQDAADLDIPCPDCGAAVGEHCEPDCEYVPGRPPLPVASPSPTTQGAPVTDTNYTAVLTNAKAEAAQADEDATRARQSRERAERHAEDMQAVEVDSESLSSQMDFVDSRREAEQAAIKSAEHATAVADGLQRRHGGLHSAHQEASVRAAKREFYEGD